jgi:glucose-6-phosphate isomerase
MLDATTTRAHLQHTLRFSPARLSDAVASHAPEAERAAAALWRRDPSAWSADPNVQRAIANRLGWLSSRAEIAASLDRIKAIADSVRRDGFSDVVLLGMGGSSLAPEVLRAVVGVTPGWPRFQMVDSTDPAAVRAIVSPPDRTLFVLASKSGTTIEPNSLAAHFRDRLEAARIGSWADHFIAITDEGTALAERARTERFREVFINPSDIGGRYSALSFFGMVPAALMGQDVDALVAWGSAMLSVSRATTDALNHPSITLGLAMGAAALNGRDKLTLIAPRALEPLGLWIEQLVAESTGKQGVGVVPIAGESYDPRPHSRDDRLIVRFHTADSSIAASGQDDALANTPVIDLEMPEPLALGAEFLRWEIATAIAGAILRINPFDEPNVQQAKDATRRLLNQYQSEGALPIPRPDRELPEGLTLRLTDTARQRIGGHHPEKLLETLGPPDYFALLAYLGPDPQLALALHELRMRVRDRTGCATMFGYGPRYLHSTGQLHKGGPNTGVFLLLTATPAADLPIPGERFSFATLEMAQALGDFASLDATGRRALHVHLPSPDPRLITQLTGLLQISNEP